MDIKLIGLIGILVLIFGAGLGSCGTRAVMATPVPEPQKTPGLSAGDAAVALIQSDMALRLTQQSIESARLEKAAQMTATQQVIDSAATQEGRRINAQGTAIAATATHEVWEVTRQAGVAQATSTAQAQAQATEQAQLGLTATIQVRETATADWKTQQAPIVAAQQTTVAAQAQSAELAANRERMTNGVIAWGPWLVALVAIIVAVFVVIRKSAFGTIAPDENGLMPGVMIIHNGQKQLILPDRMPGAILTVGPNGVSAPMLADPDRQEATTRRAQAVQAINVLPVGQQNRGMSLMNQTFNPIQARPTIEVMDASRVRPWVDEVEERLDEEM